MSISSITLSADFKKQAVKSILSIVFFILAYLLLLALSVLLTALCVTGGVMLVVALPKFITIALGIGLASLGFLILIFLLKFIFKSHKIDRSHLLEIKQSQEPELFGMIREIVLEVKTGFPKKVYLSTDVNASVFYDSNFWSMFFPIRKNLQIGIGLVNTVTKAELKAVLAHEFGHFSQRTMKVGSYVYNVNQVIYNMLFENESYDNLVQKWANVSGYFTIFVVIAVKIVQAIQWVLRKLYGVVNKSYMALSREMEFHADEIAAHVTGYEPLKRVLLRMALADHAYNSILSFYDERVEKNQKSSNLYLEQSFVMSFLAKESNLEMENDFPKVTQEELNKYNKSKLIVKDQWASHPSTEERIERLEKTNIHVNPSEEEPAAKTFKNFEETQITLTNHVFNGVQYRGTVDSISVIEFQNEFRTEYERNSFHEIFNGYYDNKNPIQFDTNDVGTDLEGLGLQSLFSDKIVDLVYSEMALRNDIETLKLIQNNQLQLKTFDYDGIKYRKKQTRDLIKNLMAELSELEDRIKQNDSRIFKFFTKLSDDQNDSELRSFYTEFLEFDKDFDSRNELINEMFNDLSFVNYTTPIDQINQNFRFLQGKEDQLKNGIRNILIEPFKEHITESMKDNFEIYLNHELKYFSGETYEDENLSVLFTALNDYSNLISKGYFLRKKRLLDHEASLVASSTN